MNKLLLVTLALAYAVLPAAQAQTGRIAHLSHGGSVAALAAGQEGQDNFGELPPSFITDSVRYLSATRLLCYGHWDNRRNPRTTDTLHLDEPMAAAAAYRYLRENRYLLGHDDKPVKFLGFDSVSTPAAKPEMPARRPRRRKAAGAWLPMLPGNLSGPTLLLASLAGAGWLLAGRKPKTSFAA